MPHSEALGAEIFLASPCLAGGAADGDHDLDRRRDRLVDPWVVGVVEMPFPSPIAANSLPQGAFEIHPHPPSMPIGFRPPRTNVVGCVARACALWWVK